MEPAGDLEESNAFLSSPGRALGRGSKEEVGRRRQDSPSCFGLIVWKKVRTCEEFRGGEGARTQSTCCNHASHPGGAYTHTRMRALAHTWAEAIRSWSAWEKERRSAMTGIKASFSCGPTPNCCTSKHKAILGVGFRVHGVGCGVSDFFGCRV